MLMLSFTEETNAWTCFLSGMSPEESEEVVSEAEMPNQPEVEL
jgi:hypothetical protein